MSTLEEKAETARATAAWHEFLAVSAECKAKAARAKANHSEKLRVKAKNELLAERKNCVNANRQE